MEDTKKKDCCCGHENEDEAKADSCGCTSDNEATEGCGCGCGCDNDDEVVTLVAEDGTEQEFFTLATYDMDDKWYIVLEPATPVEGFQEGDVIIFRLEEDENGEDVYQPIEDDAELEKVFAEFERMLVEEVE